MRRSSGQCSDCRIALFEGVRRGLKHGDSPPARDTLLIALFEGVRRGLKRVRGAHALEEAIIALFEGVRRGLKRDVGRLDDVNASNRLIRGSKAWIETAW